MELRSELYPPLEPNRSGMLAVDALHTMYWEECGNPNGVPVVFLHGGPGFGASPQSRRFFDPDFYRIVVFDQRGSGRSTPVGETRANTTQDLIADMERLREMLQIEQWLVFGGSWGSTLALAYGCTHPSRCLGFVLRGVFLGRPWELEWFMNGVRNFFPEVWQKFADHLPAAEQGNLLENYQRRFNDPDPAVRLAAARAWCIYEGSCVTLLPDPHVETTHSDETMALGVGRLEAHYFANQLFLAGQPLLEQVERISHLPMITAQGRYDVVCPPVSAWELHKAWPGSELHILPDAGHSGWEPSINRELVRACEQMKTRIAS
ncbi:prolyl aminopeptidase [Chitinimonas lacunae]|uniref:Proline iminopeptidase n=1 Tax=Chitinimonas lacunae TaxID=1963018 RepID=A0ABV8MS68_9NEIS